MTSRRGIEVSRLSVHYGGITVLDDVSFTLDPEKAMGLIGPNGSGKSTLLAAIAGFVPEARGEIRIGATDLRPLSADARARAGLGRTFQRVASFTGLTVEEQLDLVTAWSGHDEGAGRRLARRLLDACGIGVGSHPIAALPPSGRRVLDIARALWANPAVLLTDEPFAGMDGSQSAAIAATLTACSAAGIALLVVDHRIEQLVALIQRLLVLSTGRVLADGAPAEVLGRAEVTSAYQGLPASVR